MQELLDGADLETVTMKMICKQVLKLIVLSMLVLQLDNSFVSDLIL